MANKTVSNLNELTTVSNSDVLLVETATETMKVAKGNLLKEVNEQLNAKSDVNHTHNEYVTENELNTKGLATETFVTNKIAEASLNGGNVDLSGYATIDYVGSEISKIELTPGPKGDTGATGPQGPKGDPGTTTWEGITNKPTNLATETFVTQKIAEASLSGGENSNILNKIEILENDPVSADLFEGRIWIIVNNNVSAPVISLNTYAYNSITIKLDEASYNPVYGNISKYELYNNDVLLESEVITISQGMTYKIDNLTPETTYNIKLKGVLNNNNKSEFSNTINVTTGQTPQSGITTDGLAIFLKGSDFTNDPKTTVLNDLSGNENHATCNTFGYNVNTGSDRNGNVVFDGFNDNMTIAQSESISATNGFTIVFKGAINGLGQSNKTISDMLIKNNAEGGEQISLVYGYTTNAFELDGNNLGFKDGSQIVISDENIHTIIYTYDGATLCGYLDGAEVVNVSKSVSVTSPIKSTMIGKSITTNAAIKMKLRHYLFYNRGLTASEVAAIESELS